MQEIQKGEMNLLSYPNPFHSKTIIAYTLNIPGDVELNIYDLSGRKVTTLVNETQPVDRYEVEWNTEGMNPGIYFCELMTRQGRQVIYRMNWIGAGVPHESTEHCEIEITRIQHQIESNGRLWTVLTF